MLPMYKMKCSTYASIINYLYNVAILVENAA